ncbi:MAG: response regulator transcription factor [Rubrivivax sp.]|nr:response regulator transcription factor [Rubrivivax sp.]
MSDGPVGALPAAAPEAALLRVLVVDDEALARARLAQLVAEGQPPAQVVAEAAGAAAAEAQLRRLGEGGVDVVLLDIGMPGPSGLALAATLKSLPRPPAVVFVSAHAQYALQAFELQALDYLTKPVRRERLQQALERVQRWLQAQAAAMAPAVAAPAATPVLVLEERGRVLRLPHDEIVSLRAEHKAVLVRTTAQQVTVDESLNDLEHRLGSGFVRIHRNALVARHAIRALELRPGLGGEPGGGGDGWAVLVRAGSGEAGEWLAVSRRQVATVKALLGSGPG